MELLREWIITIISVIIFVAFVEILIPNSNHKRYINVVVGFLLMIVILNPITNLIGGEIDFQEGVIKTSNQLELATAKNRINNIQTSNNEAVVKLYKNEISKQLKSRIEENTEYIVKEILVEIEDDSKSSNFGLIDSFSITLKETNKYKEPPKTKIEPVQINVSLGRKNNNTVEAHSILINNESDLLKDDISNFYNVSKDNINIYVLKSN
ncbi:stage III sporulation protein AF [Alkaliphilus sp. B6464]|uniref:stage III sporulation protein AF n=1 Tax=Alkaliphilus sp. B6464 TaxID=2731219 RepID=UPI001BA72058|nr:stage III sporulation protein AF [Alkaliphilus sp. B6464]QUH20692.1 stage III sporulation protein AF [Alkaliphilus sp. B6464]